MRALPLVLILAGPVCHAAEPEFPGRAVLDDIHVLRTFRAGKNSFVEATDRHAGMWTKKGFRYTLLDTSGGPGSLRHIWTTWFPDGPYFEWQFFIDGEREPSLRGPIEKLIEAANGASAPTPAPAVPLNPAKRDFNLYLPVPFSKSLRIDVVQQTDKVGLFFCQIDYRTGDDSLAGVRLRLTPKEGQWQARYEGWRPRPRQPARTEPVRFDSREIQPGERALLGAATGPAIVRRLDLTAPIEAGLRLKVRYDNAAGFAVDAPLHRYFGEFQGVSFERLSPGRAASHLPMPFRSRCEVYLENEGSGPVRASLALELERASAFSPDWGYLHALHYRNPGTNGHQPHPVLYVRGRGHFLGMSLFRTGHDHGGGDFAVVDGESEAPSFLHGVNGEDYFTFAWFGQGQHQPYAQALTNDRGRYRHHFENPYPFQRSFAMEWGAYPNLNPESVAVWYQDTAEDTTVAAGAPEITESWDVFGPVAIPLERTAAGSGLYAALPSLADLDAGKRFTASNEGESFESGWMRDNSTGPSLNLTYISRHGAPVKGEKNLGGNGHAFLARKRFVVRSAAAPLRACLSHDDPIEVELNGQIIYRDGGREQGFRTRCVAFDARAGENQIVVRLSNYFNNTFNWTGFSLWLKDASGKPARLSEL